MNPVEYPLTLYYDGSCALCRSEIALLKSYDDQQRLRFIDCSAASFDADLHGIGGPDRTILMKTMHAQDSAGRWLSGIEVFQAAYAAIGLNILAHLWGHPWLKPLGSRLYPWLAAHRHYFVRLGLPWLISKWAARRSSRKQCKLNNCS